jgi:hypothetical protein
MNVTIERAFWLWLWPYSTKVIHGVQRGGQNHLGMGHAGKDIQAFLRGTGYRRRHGYWHFFAQPYGQNPAYQFTIGENPETHRRPLECRLTCQSARSTNPYPLWPKSVPLLKDGATPSHAILFVLDTRGRIYALVARRRNLSMFPPALGDAMRASTQAQKAQVWRGTGRRTLALPGPVRRARIPSGHRSDDLDQADPLKVAKMDTASAADEVVARLAALAAMPRRKRRTEAHRLERSRSLRLLILRLFGPECQVKGCAFSRGLKKNLLRHIVEVHHLHHIAHRGSDAPDNLAVLCANHHAIMHRDPRLAIRYSDADGTVHVDSSFGSFRISRDLRILRNTE